MELENLLNFLNINKEFYAPDFMTCDVDLINFLELITKDNQFVTKIDLGAIFVTRKTLDKVVVVDGFNRILSLSLLLHAICECYKKTSTQNDKAISTIRTKYLVNNSKTKLRLNNSMQVIYDKIIFGEKLSGKEKESSIFKLLHLLWSIIKEQNLQASNIFKMLQKVFIFVINAENVSSRDLYYSLNKDKHSLNQLLLIDSYMKSLDLQEEWFSLKKTFNNNSADIFLFFKDFFATKYNFVEFYENLLYENYVNYFETMLQYIKKDVVISKMARTAKLYKEILNVKFKEEKLRNALIQIKMHGGEDTYAYLLSIYEDYVDNNITEATFLEILLTIDEYLKNRLKTPNNVAFNELIQYLNAFITCK
jgi:hypothetical protein